VPQVEDYHSDESDIGRVFLQTSSRRLSPSAQANVSTKRPKNLESQNTPAQDKMPAEMNFPRDFLRPSIIESPPSSSDDEDYSLRELQRALKSITVDRDAEEQRRKCEGDVENDARADIVLGKGKARSLNAEVSKVAHTRSSSDFVLGTKRDSHAHARSLNATEVREGKEDRRRQGSQSPSLHTVHRRAPKETHGTDVNIDPVSGHRTTDRRRKHPQPPTPRQHSPESNTDASEFPSSDASESEPTTALSATALQNSSSRSSFPATRRIRNIFRPDSSRQKPLVSSTQRPARTALSEEEWERRDGEVGEEDEVEALLREWTTVF